MSEARRAYDLLRGYINREYDRIRGVDLESAERELNESLKSAMPPKSPPVPPLPQFSKEERARRILGVAPDAGFDEIRRAYERLNKRGDPARFAAASIERQHAAEIQKSVQWAYAVLTANVDAIEKRFKSLEID